MLNPHASNDTILFIACFPGSCIITIVTGKQFDNESTLQRNWPPRSSAHDAPGSRCSAPRARPCWIALATLPLLRFDRFTKPIYRGVNTSWARPGTTRGSVKDRAAANIVAEGRTKWEIRSRQNPARCYQRKHWHRLRHAGRVSKKFPVTLCMPEQCLGRAQKNSSGLRREYRLHRSRRRFRRRDPLGHEISPPSIRTYISTPIRTSIDAHNGRPIITERRMNLAADRRTASRTSSPCSEPAALLWGPPAA